MQARPTTCASISLLAALLLATEPRLVAQTLTRETPTTLVLPVPGTGTGGGSSMGAGAGTTILPPTLSQTGAFTDLARLAPARGLVAYEPNAILWSDHAKKTRWFALTVPNSTFGFRPDGSWVLPVGAVWVKHFDLELRRGDPTSTRRVETRFLVRQASDAEGRVTAYTYRWNDEQTDATLVPVGGAQQIFQVTENGVTRPQTWTFPSRLDCQMCHNAAGGPILSFNSRQLNRAGATGTVNQIAALAQAGYLDVSSVPAPATLPALVNAADESQPLERRIRSYLDVNCAQCHRPGIAGAGGFELLGDTGAFDARASTPLSLAGIIDGPLSFPVGDPAHRVVVAGANTRSQLLARISTRGAAQMPPLATSERDFAAESLLKEWIAALALRLPASRLLNLSARAQAGGTAGTVITGFVLAPGMPRLVLVRAVGPGLRGFDVNAALASPVLTVFDATGRAIVNNTRWNTAANSADIRSAAARVGAFALAEAGTDSAALVTLPAGAYTAHIASADNTAGATLLEVYDAETATMGSAALVNTSVRGIAGPGASVVVSGLVVGPGAMKTVLIRAVGPGLAAFGVAGPLLAAPVVTLFAGSESFHTNTRWNNAPNAAAIRIAAQQVGAFALAEASSDSAILTALSPGAYTVQATGANGTSGAVLLEIFELP
ncbi:MAG: hypothetical protein Q7S40_07665 [Opitutaceae bacterium]|nr:hypothetical protein [Opitutaceae bacterium]